MKLSTMMGGVGLGIVAGTALGLALAPEKKVIEATAKRTVDRMEHMVQDMGHQMGMK